MDFALESASSPSLSLSTGSLLGFVGLLSLTGIIEFLNMVRHIPELHLISLLYEHKRYNQQKLLLEITDVEKSYFISDLKFLILTNNMIIICVVISCGY